MERIAFHRSAHLSGVEVLHAHQSRRAWACFHTAYALCTLFDGTRSLSYAYRGRARVCQPERQLVFEPGEVHTTAIPDEPISFGVLFVEPWVMAEAARELGLPNPLPRFGGEPLAHPSLLKSCRRLHAAIDSLASPVELRLRFNECLLRLLQADPFAASRSASPPARRPIGRAADYLRANPAERISLETLASLTGLNRFHVAHEFKRVIGVPPKKYHLLQRVALARRLLRDGTAVKDAARHTGFVDANHLSRHFKRIVGVTPGVYAVSRHRRRRGH